MEELCAVGCPVAWIDDGYCDEACYNAACRWDAEDCVNAASGCADGCLPSWIDDAECDEVCNNKACGYDGTDCGAPTGECYSDVNGTDYRGNVSKTKSGLECQLWSHQAPQQHTKTHLNFPDDGLGGHNHCRNPGRAEQGPWCFTMNPNVRSELCEVSPPQDACLQGHTSADVDQGHTWAKVETALEEAARLYYTLCPRDCEALLGDGRCDPIWKTGPVWPASQNMSANWPSWPRSRLKAALLSLICGAGVACWRANWPKALGDCFPYRCDLRCNITSCAHDRGDCQVDSRGPVTFQSNTTNCPEACFTKRKLGDSNCDRECTPECKRRRVRSQLRLLASWVARWLCSVHAAVLKRQKAAVGLSPA